MIEKLSGIGIRSEHAYIRALPSIGLSIMSYLAARKVTTKGPTNKAQPDRWGLFVGQWAPRFFASAWR